MAGSIEYLIENEVVPALHRIAVALEDCADSLKKVATPSVRLISEEEKEWTRAHGEPKPLKREGNK